MAHFTCNFISYVLNRAVDVDVIIPGVTSTEAEDPKVTHKPRWKYPVLYLLHENTLSSADGESSVEHCRAELLSVFRTYLVERHAQLT